MPLRSSRQRVLLIVLPVETQAPTGEAMQGALAPSLVSPAWRLLLLSDGSVTRHLQIVSGELRIVSPCSVCTALVGW